MNTPEYVCAVIEDARQHLLLELRPPQARFAHGMLTCFGGGRERGESIHACLQRELHEELHWQLPIPADAAIACDLVQGSRFIARFLHLRIAVAAPIKTEPGVVPLWAPWSALPGLPLSPWHGLVLAQVAARPAQPTPAARASAPLVVDLNQAETLVAKRNDP